MTAKPPRVIRKRPENILLATLLSVVGGYLDAYTFIWHGVFANAQSGNFVMMAVEAAAHQWNEVWVRIPSVVAFITGLVIAQFCSTRRAHAILRHPVRWILLAEILILSGLGLMPVTLPTTALTAVVSFVAALQVSSFKSVRGTAYNTTMATGNIRSFVTALFTGVVDGDDVSKRHAKSLGAVVVAFTLGAFVGALATKAWGVSAIWVVVAILVAVLSGIVFETRRLGANGH